MTTGLPLPVGGSETVPDTLAVPAAGSGAGTASGIDGAGASSSLRIHPSTDTRIQPSRASRTRTGVPAISTPNLAAPGVDTISDDSVRSMDPAPATGMEPARRANRATLSATREKVRIEKPPWRESAGKKKAAPKRCLP